MDAGACGRSDRRDVRCPVLPQPQVWRILRVMGWSCQKPERQARKRNEEAIARWHRADWLRIKQRSKQARLPGLSLSALSRRIGLCFAVCDRNARAEQVEIFLRQAQRSLGRKLIVVMDRWAVHRKAAKSLFGDERFWTEYLPPCAPDLSPVKHVWNNTKYGDLANYVPDDLPDMEVALECFIGQPRQRPELLRSFSRG